MHRLTTTHVRRWHLHYRSVGRGHLYQGTYKSFPVQQDEHFYRVWRYAERNAQRANVVPRAKEWRWGSLAQSLERQGLKETVALSSPFLPSTSARGSADAMNYESSRALSFSASSPSHRLEIASAMCRPGMRLPRVISLPSRRRATRL